MFAQCNMTPGANCIATDHKALHSRKHFPRVSVFVKVDQLVLLEFKSEAPYPTVV